MPLLPRFGSPADLDYLTFAKWIDDEIVDKSQRARCWWSPKLTGWFPFSLSYYEHLDFQRLGPASPLDYKANVFGESTYSLKMSTEGEKLYYAVRDTYRTFDEQYPSAAWNVYSGQWRAMRVKGQTTAIGSPARSQRGVVEAKIAELKELYRVGVITDDQLDKIVLDILREYF